MPGASVADRLRHILDEIALVRSFTAGRTVADHARDPMLRRAIERSIEIISEASRHVPADMRAARPEVPWRNIADIGHVLRHGYDQMAGERIWAVIEDHLEPLEQAVRDLLARGAEDKR
jgi:uncharacterized protein with HEPN domain